MILDQIAWSDCFVFLIFLAPQLVLRVGFINTVACILKALPHLLFVMPARLLRERYFTSYSNKSPFVQHCTLFQDIVVRCVRYAFAFIPASIGKVFFSKPVALPFFRFRMLRNGFLKSPIYWRETTSPKGIYMVWDETRRPDGVVYYCHGGGFSMGSAYFYIEFLLAWVSLLKSEGGFSNPALFALEYTLVPEATYPAQVQQTLAGYKYCLEIADGEPQKICVSGDSAGATLILSLLLCMTDYANMRSKLPALAIPISPWATIISDKNQNTPSDYLNAESLHLYGSQYIGTKASAKDALVSPGACKDKAWWRRASPSKGWFFIYGAEEVFAPEARDLIALLRDVGVKVEEHEEAGWIHAWPVVKLFLCNRQQERLGGLRSMVRVMEAKMRL
ncbi:alpha/beta-hydrolase [Hortaea werneckii]|nr:alpha/beta-hydrolase [Hortaea werneckii]